MATSRLQCRGSTGRLQPRVGIASSRPRAVEGGEGLRDVQVATSAATGAGAAAVEDAPLRTEARIMMEEEQQEAEDEEEEEEEGEG